MASLDPEGPLGIYLCDVTLPAVFVRCSVSFLWNKENKQHFSLGEKNIIYFSVFLTISYFMVFLCSFIIPFTDDSISFQILLFDFLLLLTVDPCHVFSRL